jgi:hypothetical protein
MNMEVETFEATELDEFGCAEDRDEAERLVYELGLEGQDRFLGKDDSSSGNPYRKMSSEEFTVYSALMTQRTELHRFSDGPIPLRILQVAHHAKDFFGSIFVWHCPNADIKDPVLVGVNGNQFNGEFFLLARWGDVLIPFDQLRSLASKIKRAEAMAACRDAIERATARLRSIENTPEDTFILSGMKAPSYYD